MTSNEGNQNNKRGAMGMFTQVAGFTANFAAKYSQWGLA